MNKVSKEINEEVKALLEAWVGGEYDSTGLAWVHPSGVVEGSSSGSLWWAVRRVGSAVASYLSSDHVVKKLFAVKLDERIREEISTEKRTGLLYREDLKEWYAQAREGCPELEVLSQMKRQLGAYPVGRAKLLAERVDLLAKRVFESLNPSEQEKVALLDHFMRHPLQAVMTPHEVLGRILSRLPEEQRVKIAEAAAERIPLGKYLPAQQTTDYLLSFVQDPSRDPEETHHVDAALRKVQQGTPFTGEELSALVNLLQRETHTDKELQIADISGLVSYLSLHYPTLLDLVPGICTLLLRNQLRAWKEEMGRKIAVKVERGEIFQEEIEQILTREKLVALLETTFAIVLPVYRKRAVAALPEQGMAQDGWTAVADLLEDILPVAARKMQLEREFVQITKLTQMSSAEQRIELEKRVEDLLGASPTAGWCTSKLAELRGKFAAKCVVGCVQKSPLSLVEHAVAFALSKRQCASQEVNHLKVWADRQVEVLSTAWRDEGYMEVTGRTLAIALAVIAVLKPFVVGLTVALTVGLPFVPPSLLLFLYFQFPEMISSLLAMEDSSSYRKELHSREHLTDLVRRGVPQRTLDRVNSSMQKGEGVETFAALLCANCTKLEDVEHEKIQESLQSLLNKLK